MLLLCAEGPGDPSGHVPPPQLAAASTSWLWYPLWLLLSFMPVAGYPATCLRELLICSVLYVFSLHFLLLLVMFNKKCTSIHFIIPHTYVALHGFLWELIYFRLGQGRNYTASALIILVTFWLDHSASALFGRVIQGWEHKDKCRQSISSLFNVRIFFVSLKVNVSQFVVHFFSTISLWKEAIAIWSLDTHKWKLASPWMPV